MVDPTKVDMNQMPKKFIDGALGGYAKEVFSFALASGNNLEVFATTPQVMKSIAAWMSGQVSNYEKQFGIIDMTPSPVQSPLQQSDLKKPGEN